MLDAFEPKSGKVAIMAVNPKEPLWLKSQLVNNFNKLFLVQVK